MCTETVSVTHVPNKAVREHYQLTQVVLRTTGEVLMESVRQKRRVCLCRQSNASGVDTSDAVTSGCPRNTIAVKIYYPACRLSGAKTDKLLKNELSSKGREGKRGHAGVYNRNTGAKVVNQTPKYGRVFATERKKNTTRLSLVDLIVIICVISSVNGIINGKFIYEYTLC